MAEHAITPSKTKPATIRRASNPFATLQGEMNRLFRNLFSDYEPAWSRAFDVPFEGNLSTDVMETDKEIKISVEVPGMNIKDIEITVNDRYLTIRGEKKEETKEEKNGYYRQERSFGEFQRSIALPPDIADVDKAEAKIAKGVLTITIPKKASAQCETKKLSIKQVV